MKNNINKLFIVGALALSFNLSAQSKYTKKADNYFSRLEYLKAIKEYNKLVKKDVADNYVYSQLAKSYYNINSTELSEEYYSRILDSSENKEDFFNYAEVLKANGKEKEAKEVMMKFANKFPNDFRAKKYKANPNYISEILNQDAKFTMEPVSFNTPFSEFGGISLEDEVYFSSTRANSGKKNGRNNEALYNVYKVFVNEDASFSGVYDIDGDINSKYNDADAVISADGNTMYFSRDSFYEKVFEKDGKLKKGVTHLFKVVKDGEKWVDVEGFSINSSQYSIKNPALSKDGKYLYFASDMPSGFGGYDIYKSEIKEDGSLSEPVNLGDVVNTEGQEVFPYETKEGVFYFSSNGHLGLGGLDIFSAEFNNGEYTKVENLGRPANSVSDDFAFKFDEEATTGYLSSNRLGGKGSDDIYKITAIAPPCYVKLNVEIEDAISGKGLSNASVVFKTEDALLGQVFTKEDGKSNYEFECETKGGAEVILEGYEPQVIAFETAKETEQRVFVALQPIVENTEFVSGQVGKILYDTNKYQITEDFALELDRIVALLEKHENAVIHIVSHADSRGTNEYNQKLSERRAKAIKDYLLKKNISSDRLFVQAKGETQPKIDCGDNCTDKQLDANRRSVFFMMKLEELDLEEK